MNEQEFSNNHCHGCKLFEPMIKVAGKGQKSGVEVYAGYCNLDETVDEEGRPRIVLNAHISCERKAVEG